MSIRTKRRLSAIMAGLALASGATAATATPAMAGHEATGVRASSLAAPSTTSGFAVASDISANTVVNIGGGTWNYGWSVDSTGTKHCWSHYVHPTKTHSATAILGSQSDKETKSPKIWAKADVYGSIGNTCYTYWSTS